MSQILDVTQNPQVMHQPRVWKRPHGLCKPLFQPESSLLVHTDGSQLRVARLEVDTLGTDSALTLIHDVVEHGLSQSCA